jgi:hypothetical protein
MKPSLLTLSYDYDIHGDSIDLMLDHQATNRITNQQTTNTVRMLLLDVM